MGSHLTPPQVYEYSNLQKSVSENFWLAETSKTHKNKNVNPQKNFIIISSKRKCWKIEQQLKVEIEDGREAYK